MLRRDSSGASAVQVALDPLPEGAGPIHALVLTGPVPEGRTLEQMGAAVAARYAVFPGSETWEPRTVAGRPAVVSRFVTKRPGVAAVLVLDAGAARAVVAAFKEGPVYQHTRGPDPDELAAAVAEALRPLPE